MQINSIRKFFFIVCGLLLQIFIQSCSTDPPAPIRYYANPIWSPDGNTVAVQERNALVTVSLNTHVSFIDAKNGTSTNPNISVSPLYPIGYTVTGEYLYQVDPSKGMSFYKINDGTFAGSIQYSGWRLSTAAFSTAHSSLLIARNQSFNQNTPVQIVLITYSASPWNGSFKILLDTVNTTNIRSMVWINPSTFAVRFIGGTIVVMDTAGTITDKFVLKETDLADYYMPQFRLSYQQSLNRIYAKDDEGLKTIDLNTKQLKKIIDGNVVDFDIAGNGRFLAFQTTSDDIWISDAEGDPKYRILPHSHEPRFSPDGNQLAAVYVKSSDYNELVINDVH